MKGWDSDPVVVTDLNDDGLPDVAIGGPGNDVTLLVNTTPKPGNYCNLYPRMAAPNPFAVGTRVEVFRGGDLGLPKARPMLSEKAHADSTPIHIGLGTEKAFDLRITFPGRDPLEFKNVAAQERMTISADGDLRAGKP